MQAYNNKEVQIKPDSYFIELPINKLSILIENIILALKWVNHILIEYEISWSILLVVQTVGVFMVAFPNYNPYTLLNWLQVTPILLVQIRFQLRLMLTSVLEWVTILTLTLLFIYYIVTPQTILALQVVK